MRDRLLLSLAAWHSNHPNRMLLVAALITVVMIGMATRLSVTMRWSDILPARDRRTIEYNKIVDEFVSATSIIIVVQGDERRMKRFADELAPRILSATDTLKNHATRRQIGRETAKLAKLKSRSGAKTEIDEIESSIAELRSHIDRRLVRRVDYKTEVEFLKNHGLMLIEQDDLNNLSELYTNPNLSGLLFNLNQAMEKEYVGKRESISTRVREDRAVAYLDGLRELIHCLERSVGIEPPSREDILSAADRLLIGEPYFLSYDRSCLVMEIIPNFTIMDMALLITGTEIIQGIVDETLERYPHLRAGLTGMIPISHDEMVYSERSLGYTSLIALAAILILLIVSMRMWVAPVFAMANLLLGIVWAIGINGILVGQLNIMTQMMTVILLGLGIDYSIHLIAGFTEWRAAGMTVHDALANTFIKSGKAIVTGALTTSFAFFSMIISSSRGMKEMGIVTATGLMAILLSTFLILPVFLVFRERRIDKRRQSGETRFVQRDLSFSFLGRLGQWLGHHHQLSIAASAVLTLLLIWSASRITFDQNYLNIEPKGLPSVTLQDTIITKFDLDMNQALILTDSPDASRILASRLRELSSVAMTDDIGQYLPSDHQQRIRAQIIEKIRKTMVDIRIEPEIDSGLMPFIRNEITRLEMNIMEIQDMAFLGGQDLVDGKCRSLVGDPENSASVNLIDRFRAAIDENPARARKGFSRFQRHFAPYFQASVIGMTGIEPIELLDLPKSILNRYSNDSHSQFLVTVYAAGALWQDAGFLRRFVDDLNRITDRATGMPPIFRALIEIIGQDGKRAMMLTLVVVFILLCFDFRRPKYALISMIPLAGGVVWMVGLMAITGQRFTVMNVMGLPMIIGIGIDDGVHIVHRWLHEGKGRLHTVFSSTGKAILLTTLTTMLAFGSLIFSIWRGFGHLGGALFVGVAACFLTTLLILSGIIGVFERRDKVKIGSRIMQTLKQDHRQTGIDEGSPPN